MDLNKVMLIGRLPQDSELRTLPNGSAVASFSVATGRQWKDKTGERQKQTEFHRVVVWGRLAETMSQYLHKGKPVYIEGRLHTRDWTGEDGVKRYRTEVVAENIILLGSKPNGQTAAQSPAAEEQETEMEVTGEEIKVEEIPFN